MSKVVKGVGKVFKKVVKVAKKALPYALAVGAVVFTAGSALGIAGMAGGWSAASASIGTALGGSGTLGTVLTSAVYQAGIGAASGAALAGVTGKNIGKGAQVGAAVGAATGAGTGLLAPGSVNMTTLGQANAAKNAGTVGSGAGSITTEKLAAAAPNPANATEAVAGGASPSSVQTVANAGGEAAKQTGVMGWMNENPVLASAALNSAGTGLLAMSQGDDNSAAQRAEETRKNYGSADQYTGLLRSSETSDVVRQSPQERFNYSYQWNPQTRRLEKVAAAA